MSDAEMAIDVPEEQQAPKAKATPSRRGRGRRRGGGITRGRLQKAAAAAGATSGSNGPAAAGPKGTGRRGRLKQFHDSFVQANYERQRETKMHYAQVAAVVKSALQDLADRNVQELIDDPDAYKRTPEYPQIIGELNDLLEDVVSRAETVYEMNTQVANRLGGFDAKVVNDSFIVRFPRFLPRFALLSSCGEVPWLLA